MSDVAISGNVKSTSHADRNIKASSDIEVGANITSVSNGELGGANYQKSSDVTVIAISESKIKILDHRNFISFIRIQR